MFKLKNPELIIIEISSESDSVSSLSSSNPSDLEINTNELGTIKKPKHTLIKKKRRICKSRSMRHESKKRRILSKHKWCDDVERVTDNSSVDTKYSSTYLSPYDDEYNFQSVSLSKVTKLTFNDCQLDSGTSIKSFEDDRNYYSLVHVLEKSNLIQEVSESQEFDDVQYILDALQDNNTTEIRCLSGITFATKCMTSAFRIYVCNHGVLVKFFKALHDVTNNQSLSLCIALVMFILSQDPANMDLDSAGLELMLSLLESDINYETALTDCGLNAAQVHKNIMKIKEFCADIQSQGYIMNFNLENITIGQLTIEALLSLTSKRAGGKFKEELRELGGLKYIIEIVCECCSQIFDCVVIWTDQLLHKLKIADRCIRVLENVTQNNEQNQTYLILYNNGILLYTLVKLYRLCNAEIPLYPSTDIADKDSIGFKFREALLVTLKVLINLTHNFHKNSTGSALLGKQSAIIDTSLHLLIQVPHYIPVQKKFELKVLVLILLINLIQIDDNKKLLFHAKAIDIFACDVSGIEVLIKEFNHCEKMAKKAEKKTDAILNGKLDSEFKSHLISQCAFIEETVTNLLEKTGIHMEYTYVASYIAILIGFFIMNNVEYETNVRTFLRGHNFNNMLDILNKFFNFMCLTVSSEASMNVIRDTDSVIKYMKESNRRLQSNIKQLESHIILLDV